MCLFAVKIFCSFFKGEELLHLKGVTFHNKLSKNRNVFKWELGI